MFQDSWGLYEAPYSRRRIFHPRKRSVTLPLLTLLAAAVAVFEALSRF
ncbi:MAG: hypothetical protein JWP16_538 [Alphaproteobacteria bacterium]|jgi:hypothetical protein|nr:hypothetical protein [Alphaproteobacteria bacterium]